MSAGGTRRYGVVPTTGDDGAPTKPRAAGEPWVLERWPRFGLYLAVVLIGWLVLDVLPWWSLPLVVAVDAAWSARRGDWSLAAFLAWGAVVVTVTVTVVALVEPALR